MNAIAARPNSRWSIYLPLFLAPLVAGIYYLSLRSAFSASIQYVVESAKDVNPFSSTAPHWGSHWIYRIFSEGICIAYATFVTAGIARSQPRIAGLIAGATIAIGYAARVGFVLWACFTLHPQSYPFAEPWYQFAIEGALIVASPLIGYAVSEFAADLNADYDAGFAGINRAHFVWLWIVLYWYGLGMISPVMHFYMDQSADSVISDILSMLVYGIPAAAFLFPLFYGLAFLSGNAGGTWRPYARNLAGTGILLGGVILGGGVQFLWAWLIRMIFGSH